MSLYRTNPELYQDRQLLEKIVGCKVWCENVDAGKFGKLSRPYICLGNAIQKIRISILEGKLWLNMQFVDAPEAWDFKDSVKFGNTEGSAWIWSTSIADPNLIENVRVSLDFMREAILERYGEVSQKELDAIEINEFRDQ